MALIEAKKAVREPDAAEQNRRVDFFRSWFEGFVDKPMSMRSNGTAALPPEYFAATAEFIAQALQLNSDVDSVLDVGCDSAMVSRLVSPRCRRFVGVDFIPGMLAQIPRDGVRAGGGPAGLAAADGRFLPFRSRAFTKVYSSAVIHTLPSHVDGLKMIEEMLRICRPGGAVLIANIPDAAKHGVAVREVLRHGRLAERLKTVLSLAAPRWAKDLLHRLGVRPSAMVLLEYDFAELQKTFEPRGFRCEIRHLPESYYSRDFRLTRSSLLIRVPAATRGDAGG
ncbi:MAG: methyltransferase domain-containing protein [Candidatus Binatia bacterium]